MFRGPRYRGGPIMMSAISSIDIALWDIFGKALELPVWQLLPVSEAFGRPLEMI